MSTVINKNKSLREGVSAILNKKIIIYPTETCYGIGGNALIPEVIKKIRKIKKKKTPLLILVADLKEAQKYCHLNNEAKKLAKKFMPGALTLIVPKKKILPESLAGKKIGFRISSDKFAKELCKKSKKPIISTSANLHGEKEIYSAKKAVKHFENKVDLIIDAGKLKKEKPSTVYDVELRKILRKGKINLNQINSVIK